MNMLQTASVWLNKQRADYLSEPIEFIHFADGSQQTYELIATRGRTIFRAETDYGITVRIHSVDFLISSALLTFIPAKGDEIHHKGKRFEVLAPNDEPVWRWSDANQQIMRIHTKEIGEVSNE